jgi:hypothetical protein
MLLSAIAVAGCSADDASNNTAADAAVDRTGVDGAQQTTYDTGSPPYDADMVADAGADADGSSSADADGGSNADAADASLSCPPVVLAYQGWVATVANSPLGLDASVRESGVAGTVAYLPCVPDTDPNPQRGVYPHPFGGDFTLSVGGLTVTGSGKPLVQVEDFNPDTFRWRDGKIPLDPVTRVMNVNGMPAPDVEVTLAITDGSGAAFTSDALPTRFPMLNISSYPHTFSVQDNGGTLLMQLSTMTQQ